MAGRSFVTVRPAASRASYDALGSATLFTTYEAPNWLPGGQLQTIYAYYLKQTPNFTYRRERGKRPIAISLNSICWTRPRKSPGSW
jgi:predicted alpha/beta-fold hydrolase